MTSLQLTVELPPRPIGTHFAYSPKTYKNKYDAEITGYHVEHDTDTGLTMVIYRIACDLLGQRITATVPCATVEGALGAQS